MTTATNRCTWWKVSEISGVSWYSTPWIRCGTHTDSLLSKKETSFWAEKMYYCTPETATTRIPWAIKWFTGSSQGSKASYRVGKEELKNITENFFLGGGGSDQCLSCSSLESEQTVSKFRLWHSTLEGEEQNYSPTKFCQPGDPPLSTYRGPTLDPCVHHCPDFGFLSAPRPPHSLASGISS